MPTEVGRAPIQHASAVEGGQSNTPSLKMISEADNTNQDRRLNANFYVPCQVNKDNPYFVLPVPLPGVPTFGVCKT